MADKQLPVVQQGGAEVVQATAAGGDTEETPALTTAAPATDANANASSENDKQQQKGEQDATAVTDAAAAATAALRKKRKGSKNAGSKKGGKRQDRPQSFWYRLCQIFESGGYKSQIEFLRSADSGEDVGEQQRMHLSRAYRKYQNGTLGNCEETRSRKRKYEPLEQRVIQYWTEQQQQHLVAATDGQQQQPQGEYGNANTTAIHATQLQHQQHSIGGAQDGRLLQQQQQNNNLFYEPMQATTTADCVFPPDRIPIEQQQQPNNNNNNTTNQSTLSPTNKRRRKGNTFNTVKSPMAWSILQQKAKEWAVQLGLDDGFQASAGWIDNVLKRHQRDTEARNNRDSLDVTLASRRTGANFSQRQLLLAQDIQRSDQQALMMSCDSGGKGLAVGDRVTVLDLSQQAGDLIITHVGVPASSPSVATAAAVVGKVKGKQSRKTTTGTAAGALEGTMEEEEEHVAYVTVERRRHGSTQSFSVRDVRTVVKHLAQGETSATMQQLLQPGLDAFLRAKAHFPKDASLPATASRVLRPVWETKGDGNAHHPHQEGDNLSSNKMTTTSMRLQYCDTSCPEKISLHALRSHILPIFRKDQKQRDRLLVELQTMSTRSKAQQDVMEKLWYAQMTHDMARDLFDLVRDIPAKDKNIVYQVDYQPRDVSMRGRLFALNPAPLAEDASTRSYAPRPLTLQAMPQDLRNALAGSFAHRITTEQDMGVVVLCSLADMAHASNLIPSWLDYRLHASAWCDYIQQVHGGVSKAQAQLLPQVLLHGGTYETWKQAMDEQTEITIPSNSDVSWTSLQTFVLKLATEWRTLRDVVLALSQYAWAQLDKAALLASHDCAPAAIPDICLVRIMHACERDIWTLVEHILQDQGWTVRTKLIDGLLVEAPSISGNLSNVLTLAEAAVKSRGWDIGLTEGPCFGLFNHKEPVALLQSARTAMQEMQNESELQEQDGTIAGDAETKQQDRMVRSVEGSPPKGSLRGNLASNGNAAELDPAAAAADLQLFAQL